MNLAFLHLNHVLQKSHLSNYQLTLVMSKVCVCAGLAMTRPQLVETPVFGILLLCCRKAIWLVALI